MKKLLLLILLVNHATASDTTHDTNTAKVFILNYSGTNMVIHNSANGYELILRHYTSLYELDYLHFSTLDAKVTSDYYWTGPGFFITDIQGGAVNAGVVARPLAPPIQTITAAFDLTTNNHTINYNGAGLLTKITLPNAVGNTNIFRVKNIHATGSYVLTNATGAQTIDGKLSYTNAVQYQSIDVQSDGANWWIY